MSCYSFKATGLERKQIALVISEATAAQVKYAGPPTFAYEVGYYSIDRNSAITAPVDESLSKVLAALKEKGVTAEGDGIITIPMDKNTGVSLRNLVNSISSKDRLLQKALGRTEPLVPYPLVELVNSVRLETAEDFVEAIDGQNTGGLLFDLKVKTIGFGFYSATLEAEEVKAYLALSNALDEQAKRVRHTSFAQKEAENDKYTFRCFLLRLGFIGDEFKTERKILLSRLEGNGAFKAKAAKSKEEAIC
jgi:hypothetical protein